MFVRKLTLLAMAASMLLATAATRAADDDALLNLLVRKHLISEQDAAEVRADLKKEAATSSAEKWKLSTPISELELYGDARVRYEIRSGETGPPNYVDPRHDTLQRNRARYRLRIGLKGKLTDDWFFGVRLETSSNGRSTNVTFGDDSGPFGKGSDGMFVGQAYLGYTGFKGLKLTGGKIANPFVTSSMVWDGDLNPEGISEQYKYTIKLGGGGAAEVASTSKDGKGVVPAPPPPPGMTIDLFANLGQFVYDDVNPDNPIGQNGLPHTDAFLLGWQVGAKFNFTKDMHFQLAPTIYNYTGHGDSFNGLFSGDPDVINASGQRVSLNQNGTNSLLVFELPVEFAWKCYGLPMRAFADFAVNFDADDRAAGAGHPDDGDQRYAYQIGLSVGKLKAKGDWQLTGFYQHVDQYALDPNLVDSDIFDSRVNMEGPALSFGYGVSDAIFANLTYAYGWQVDHALGTGGVGDIGLNPLRRFQLFQADLSVKF
jgi:Putative porin